MNLILWRHADAVPGSDALPDLERPLTSKGVRQAARMADWLNQVLPESTRILCSPARRTVQTADALGRRYRRLEALGPEGTVQQLLTAVRWPDGREATLVVGHQPTLGLAAACLMGCRGVSIDSPWRIKKGAVWWLRGKSLDDETLQVDLVAIRSTDFL